MNRRVPTDGLKLNENILYSLITRGKLYKIINNNINRTMRYDYNNILAPNHIGCRRTSE